MVPLRAFDYQEVGVLSLEVWLHQARVSGYASLLFDHGFSEPFEAIVPSWFGPGSWLIHWDTSLCRFSYCVREVGGRIV